MSVAFALDLLVAGLLVATIAYAVVLNRRLQQVRDGSAHMERMISDFYQATTRAESGVAALKEVAGRSDTEVLAQLDSLTKLRDELDFLVSRAEVEGARLEQVIRDGRDGGPPKRSTAAPAMAPDAALDAELFASAATGAADQPGRQRGARPPSPRGGKQAAREETR